MTAFKTFLLAGALAAGTALASLGTANAAIITCEATIATNVSGASACERSTTQDQDFLNTNPITVNAEGGFFDFTDWQFFGKIGEEGPPATGAGTGEGQSGTYDLDGFATLVNADDVMLIFKDGQGTFLVGYLLANLVGTWDSPFEEPPFDFNGASPKDVSHISVYFRGQDTPVPTPGVVGLLGLGLLGLGVLARRRKLV